ncbi:hypothetical protein ACF068_25905 [Streptomyces sp. NPDC016309]|uniref:hypothetical protein n=1 Tax=Streptomyces sp. NPDC016309 TaxID=3364965 RepID=UPI0036F6E5B7
MAAALGLTVALPGGPGPAWAADPGGYAFAEGIEPVRGAETSSDAPVLKAGVTYKDAVEGGGKRIYRLDLDAGSNAYVSAVAVPPPGSEVGLFDSLKVSLQDRNGLDCSSNETRFGSAAFPRPLAAYAHRTLNRNRSACRQTGAYFAVVERTTKAPSSAGAWDLEIRHEREPGLRAEGPTAASGDRAGTTPPVPAGGSGERTGGAGFSDATGLTEGEWTDRIEPGRSLFYRVPVDWGQQIFAGADLGSSSGRGFVAGALALTLYNPARGVVAGSEAVGYDGKQKSADLGPLPPVRYENRFDSSAEYVNTRFAGWYYLRVSLSPEVGEKFGRKPYGLTLRIGVEGTPQAGPAYDGPPGIFDVTEADRDAAAHGRNAAAAEAAAERGGTMRLVAAAGIGTGTVLVLGLGAWTVLARRRTPRAGAGAGPPGYGPGAGPPGYGPPAGW